MTLKKFAGNQPGALEVVFPLLGKEEDEAGSGNPVALGNTTAVFWLAPEGVVKKGAPY